MTLKVSTLAAAMEIADCSVTIELEEWIRWDLTVAQGHLFQNVVVLIYTLGSLHHH